MQGFYNFLVNNELLKSNLLLALVTLAVALVALYIYRKQHYDERRGAAQTIFSEIVSAEQKLKGIRERFFAVPNPSLEANKLMAAENWSRYKYLFVRDLTAEEWGAVDSFYSNCASYDVAVELNNSYFHQDVKHNLDAFDRYYYEVIMSFHDENPGGDKLGKEASDDLKDFQNKFLANRDAIFYRPNKSFDDARLALVALDTSISLSSVGQKLKHIAKI